MTPSGEKVAKVLMGCRLWMMVDGFKPKRLSDGCYYVRILARDVTEEESDRMDGVPIDYEPRMESKIKKVNGEEWLKMEDAHGNFAED